MPLLKNLSASFGDEGTDATFLHFFIFWREQNVFAGACERPVAVVVSNIAERQS